jgi:patatin-like phospholipase/acyl hydrolase
MFGEVLITDAITPEVNIVAYDYKNREPRLFSKAFAQRLTNNEHYNLTLKDASEASASAPIYFDPKAYGDQILVDGGIIANNPAFYSYLFSKQAHKQN